MQKLILQKNIDTMTHNEKIKVESFKEKILQNLRNIKERFDSELQSSNLNVRNWYKNRQLGTKNK